MHKTISLLTLSFALAGDVVGTTAARPTLES